MKSFIHKITSTLLAALLVFSTFSFAVEKHFCGDYLVDISFLGNASLCSVASDDICDTLVQIEKKNCCKDEVLKIEGQQDIAKNAGEKFTTFKQVKDFLIPFTLSFLRYQEIQITPFKECHYVPPKISFNLQMLYETYLI